MAKLHVKKGDTVLVIAGKDKGKTGKVLNAMPSENAVVVEGVNIVNKHKKPRNAQEKGGIVKLENKIDVSNVQVVCAECKKATRVATKVENGKTVRVCKHCGASLDKAVTVKKPAKKADTKVAEAAKTQKATKTTKTATKAETKKAAPKTTKAATEKSRQTTKTVVRKTGDKV